TVTAGAQHLDGPPGPAIEPGDPPLLTMVLTPVDGVASEGDSGGLGIEHPLESVAAVARAPGAAVVLAVAHGDPDVPTERVHGHAMDMHAVALRRAEHDLPGIPFVEAPEDPVGLPRFLGSVF